MKRVDGEFLVTAKLENLETAAALERSGKWSDLLAFAKQWVREEPTNVLASQAIGDALRKLNRPQDALHAYEEALGIAPPMPTHLLGVKISAASIWYRIGHVRFELGDAESAVEAFEEAGRIDAGAPDIWNDLGVVYMQLNNAKAAFDAFKKAVTADPTNLPSLKNLGLIYAMSGVKHGVDDVHRRMLALDRNAAQAFIEQASKILSAA